MSLSCKYHKPYFNAAISLFGNKVQWGFIEYWVLGSVLKNHLCQKGSM